MLESYQGMKQRQDRIQLKRRVLILEAREGLIQLYEDWGKPEEAEKWRQEKETGSETNGQDDSEGAAHE